MENPGVYLCSDDSTEQSCGCWHTREEAHRGRTQLVDIYIKKIFCTYLAFQSPILLY